RVGVETAQHGQIGPTEDHDVRVGARARPGDDVGVAVAIDVAGRHGNAAEEARGVGEEAGDLRPGDAVEDLDVRAGARADAGDDVGDAVAGDVAGGHVDAAREGRAVGEEAEAFGAGGVVEDAHHRRIAGAGAHGQVGGDGLAGGDGEARRQGGG